MEKTQQLVEGDGVEEERFDYLESWVKVHDSALLKQIQNALDDGKGAREQVIYGQQALRYMQRAVMEAYGIEDQGSVEASLVSLVREGILCGENASAAHVLLRTSWLESADEEMEEGTFADELYEMKSALCRIACWFANEMDPDGAKKASHPDNDEAYAQQEDADFYDQGWASFFGGIQFSKSLFQKLPADVLSRFCMRFPHILYQQYCILQGKMTATNRVKFMKGMKKQEHLPKAAITRSYRLFWEFSEGDDGRKIMNLLSLVPHDVQDSNTRREALTRGRRAGRVFWKAREFLDRLHTYQVYRTTYFTPHEFQQYVMNEATYVYDDTQERIVESAKKERKNLSVVGNAGSGKSLVGEGWLRKRVEERESCIYLTLSQNLTEQKKQDYRRNLRIQQKEDAFLQRQTEEADDDRLAFSSISDFLQGCARKQLRREGRQDEPIEFLDAEESFHVFEQVCRRVVHGWQVMDSVCHGSRSTAIGIAWRKIHGILKGCAEWKDRKSFDWNQEPFRIGRKERRLTDESYLRREQKKNKCEDVLKGSALGFVRQLLQLYEKELAMRGAWDDNDVALYILTHCRPLNDYRSAFIDECQDLTEKELLALSYLLKQCSHKLMASDRCQMIQPTLFDPSIMLTNANKVGGMSGAQLPSQFLHCNYRSTKQVVAFQMYIMNHLNGIATLREEEHQPIYATAGHVGMRPVWIMGTASNAKALHKLLDDLDETSLKILRADSQIAEEKGYPPPAGWEVEDMRSCKGLEYPSVLLWNVLSDTISSAMDAAWSWRYFYVGATRAEKRLLIYERDTSGEIGAFLRGASEEGLVDVCDDLLAKQPGKQTSWLTNLKTWLGTTSAEDQLVLAENYRIIGNFAAAARIYKRFLAEGYREEYLRCDAKVHIAAGEVVEAMSDLLQLEDADDDIEEVISRTDTDQFDYLAGRIYAIGRLDIRGFINLRKDYIDLFHATEEAPNFDADLTEVIERYPMLREKVVSWKKTYYVKVFQRLRQFQKVLAG